MLCCTIMLYYYTTYYYNILYCYIILYKTNKYCAGQNWAGHARDMCRTETVTGQQKNTSFEAHTFRDGLS